MQGAIATNLEELLVPTLRALETEDVKTLLTDSSDRTRIKHFQTEVKKYNASTIASQLRPALIAVTLLKQLATTKQPVQNNLY